jgi:transcriptional regulator with XRE-family HTH domain
MSKMLGTVIRQARKAKGMTQAVLASHLDVERAAVGQWETGATEPASANLMNLCSFLGIDVNAAGAGKLVYISPESDVSSVSPKLPSDPGAEVGAGQSEVLRSAMEVQGLATMPVDVPVYGVAVGGADGSFLFNGEVIDHVRRPAGIARTRGVFALYVVGSSMEPRFEEGELVYVSSGRPPSIGDYVIVERKAPNEGENGPSLIKRLVRRTGANLVLEQFNPGGLVEVPTEDVKSVYRVLPWNEVLGV